MQINQYELKEGTVEGRPGWRVFLYGKYINGFYTKKNALKFIIECLCTK